MFDKIKNWLYNYFWWLESIFWFALVIMSVCFLAWNRG